MKSSATGLLLALLLVSGCWKAEKAKDTSGTAQSAYSDVIASDRGYIVENARFAADGEPAAFMIGDKFRLAPGNSSILILRERDSENTPGYILALQLPSFAPGTSIEYKGNPDSRFYLMGRVNGAQTMALSGIVSGSLRLLTKQPSKLNLGLDREITDGVGDIEIAVSGIAVQGLRFQQEKKFAARFMLPILSLAEMSRISQSV